jgi:hypothetical protein
MMSEWRQLLASADPEVQFRDPAPDAELAKTEAALGVRLPADLRALLQASNGVTDRYGADLVWPATRLVHSNIEFRTHPDFAELYMPFDSLLFFSDEGGGDQFAYVITAGQVRRPDIFVWQHETDSRIWVASDLTAFIQQRLSGTLHY